MRSIRLIQIVGLFEGFRRVIDTIALIIPSLFTYLLLMLSIFYMFSMVGLEIFAEVIKSQDPNESPYNCFNGYLNGSDFAK